MTRFQSASSISSSRTRNGMPALLTRPSTRPCACSIHAPSSRQSLRLGDVEAAIRDAVAELRIVLAQVGRDHRRALARERRASAAP